MREPGQDVLLASRMFAEDDGFGGGTVNLSRLAVLIPALEAGLGDSGMGSPFWEAEIWGAKARLLGLQGGDDQTIFELWRRAADLAVVGGNGRMLVHGGGHLGFQLVLRSGSFRELSARQLQSLRGAEMVGLSVEFVGRNLAQLWRQLEYRRLSDSDLDTKKMLMDAAKELAEFGTPAPVAAAAMILLLVKLHSYQGPSVGWAQQQLEGQDTLIPAAVRLRHGRN